MNTRYSKAATVGLVVGVLLTGCNLYFYWLYQRAMANYWTSEMSKYVDNFCVGVDSYFYLIIVSTIVYAAGGIASVYYTRRHLEHWIHASRVTLVTGVVACILSLPVTCAFIASGLFTQPVPSAGWALIYAIYAVIGIFFCMETGIRFYRYLTGEQNAPGGGN